MIISVISPSYALDSNILKARIEQRLQLRHLLIHDQFQFVLNENSPQLVHVFFLRVTGQKRVPWLPKDPWFNMIAVASEKSWSLTDIQLRETAIFRRSSIQVGDWDHDGLQELYFVSLPTRVGGKRDFHYIELINHYPHITKWLGKGEDEWAVSDEDKRGKFTLTHRFVEHSTKRKSVSSQKPGQQEYLFQANGLIPISPHTEPQTAGIRDLSEYYRTLPLLPKNLVKGEEFCISGAKNYSDDKFYFTYSWNPSYEGVLLRLSVTDQTPLRGEEGDQARLIVAAWQGTCESLIVEFSPKENQLLLKSSAGTRSVKARRVSHAKGWAADVFIPKETMEKTGIKMMDDFILFSLQVRDCFGVEDSPEECTLSSSGKMGKGRDSLGIIRWRR
jgi:hypothetical protein